MNSNAGKLDAKHGGRMAFGDGFFVHTFNRLVPVEKYYDTHPEYFSLVGGKRQKEKPQLCCTNPDVIRLCTEGVLEAMRSQPEATVFSVSQNDCYHECECPRCQKLAKEEGTEMAPVLRLVNCVAEAVEKEFPDKIVETLAYQWTRKPPRSMRPRPNVVVRLCSFECCFSHPLDKCDGPINHTFVADLEAWSKVTPRLWVWDYVTDFGHYLLPFPNQRVRGPNVRFFVNHHVKGVYEEDIEDSPDSELAAMGGYIAAKLLWNPNYDTEHAMDEFLEAFYGNAASPIRAYLDILHDYVQREDIHLGLTLEADSPYLTDDLLIKANELWQQAASLAATDPDVLQRVKLSRMSVDYAIVERARLQAQQKLPANAAFMSLAVARFQPFCEVLQGSAMTYLGEQTPLDKKAYCRDLARDLRLQP